MRCDIIIPVWNQLRLTKECVDSIRKHTKYPYRLIIVDNASDDDTSAYLESIKGADTVVIRNEKNSGFVKAVNQGIAASNAPYVCLLNNDTLVTEGWLEEMVLVAGSDKHIGIINPASNNLGQKAAEGEPIELYARRLRKDTGKFKELGSAIGFCMLIKREVLDRIGNFDEIFGMGNFEDMDFSRRAVKEGYRCVVAHAAYVYHWINTSFNKVKTFDDDFQRNREIYEFRWGKPLRVVYILDSYDINILKRLGANSIKLARGGNWVSYYLHEDIEIPSHANIIITKLPLKFFYANVLIRILKKKKKFDEIFVGGQGLYNILNKLTFIHRAKVSYY